MNKYEDFPITKASFNLTRACNLACDYCFTHGCTKGDMPIDIAKRAVDFLFANAEKCRGRDREVEISFWGGEPLLKWELLKEIALYAQDVSKRTAIPVKFGGTTNGVLLTPDKFPFLDSVGCKFLVSFDGTPETHNAHRKFRDGSGSHAIVEKNLKAALAHYKDYRPRQGLLAERVDHFFEDMKYLFDLGADHLVFSPVYEGDWTDEKWAIFEEQGKKVVDYMAELREKGRTVTIQHFQGYGAPDNSPYPCGAGRFYVGIDIDGAIYPCHRFNKFDDERPWQEKEVCIGHIDHGITRPEFRKWFIDWEHGCGECERLKDTPCHGGCYAVRFDLTGGLDCGAMKTGCKYVNAQHNISMYMKEKIPMPEQTLGPCVCNNMCYAEGTDRQLINVDPNTDASCLCNLSHYGGGPNEGRILTSPERMDILRSIRPQTNAMTSQDREVIKRIFADIDRRLTAIEAKLEMTRK